MRQKNIYKEERSFAADRPSPSLWPTGQHGRGPNPTVAAMAMTSKSGHHPNGGTLDVIATLINIPGVKTLPIKIVGQLHKTPWQRFARLQATAALLAKGKGQRKGVFRFASHEECAQWTASQTKS